MTLNQLKRGRKAHVSGFADNQNVLVARLREIGFAEGGEVELMHQGPFGGKPLCFRLNRTLIALRGDEAKAITVELA